MQITIAISNLSHPEWAKQYFPEDLPQDWQFDYYANEFSALLSSDETLAQEARSDFLLVTEVKHENQQLQRSNCSLLVVAFSSKVIELPSGIEISQAEIISQHNISETVCILRVASDHLVENNELKTLLMHIRSKYSHYDRVCLFLSRSMQNIEIISTCKIINDLL